MATQTHGKGKKKNKEVMKLSLDEFQQIDAPHGHSVVNVKYTGLDWAATMADHDQQVAETQQIIVPTAPRAQRGPDVDFDSLPTEPPFRVSLFHVPIAAEDRDITDRFFSGIKVLRVDIQKASTTVELETREDMYEALCKDGSSLKGKTVSVCLYGQQPQNNYNQDRYGGRGSNSSYGDRSYQSGGGFGNQRIGDKYGDRSGGYNSDRDSYNSYNRAAGGQSIGPAGGTGRMGRSGPGSSGGYGQRNEGGYGNRDNYGRRYTPGEGDAEPSDEPENWRARSTLKSVSPQPTQQTPQPTSASDEVENWRARPTVKPDPPSQPTSTEPPYRVSLFGVPIGTEETEIKDNFLSGLRVERVDIQNNSTTVDFATKEDMHEALNRDGTSVGGKVISTCIYGQQPQSNNYSQERYGGRGSNSSYGDRSYHSGGSGGFGSQRLSDKHGDRYGDRDSYNAYGGRGSGGPGSGGRNSRGNGGYGQRYEVRYNNRNSYRNRYEGEQSEEPENWRARPTSNSTPPQQQAPQPSSDEVENWRARPTVRPDPPTAPTS